MSVLQNPIRVMETPIAQTVMDLTAVFVDRDSLEMAQHVKVSEDIVINRSSMAPYVISLKVHNRLHS